MHPSLEEAFSAIAASHVEGDPAFGGGLAPPCLTSALAHFSAPTAAHAGERFLHLVTPHAVVNRDVALYLGRRCFLDPFRCVDQRPWVLSGDPRCVGQHADLTVADHDHLAAVLAVHMHPAATKCCAVEGLALVHHDAPRLLATVARVAESASGGGKAALFPSLKTVVAKVPDRGSSLGFLPAAAPQLTSLDFGVVTPADTAAIARMPRLRVLCLHMLAEGSPLGNLGACRELRTLTLRRCTVDCLDHVLATPTLTELRLDAVLRCDLAAALCRARAPLETFALDTVKAPLPFAGIASAPVARTLQRVLVNTGWEDTDVAPLGSLPHLTELTLTQVTLAAPLSAVLAPSSSLSRLFLSRVRPPLGPADFAAMAGLPLGSLTLDGARHLKAGHFEALSASASLTFLSLSECTFAPTSNDALSALDLPTLKTVVLECDGVFRSTEAVQGLLLSGVSVDVPSGSDDDLQWGDIL